MFDRSILTGEVSFPTFIPLGRLSPLSFSRLKSEPIAATIDKTDDNFLEVFLSSYRSLEYSSCRRPKTSHCKAPTALAVPAKVLSFKPVISPSCSFVLFPCTYRITHVSFRQWPNCYALRADIDTSDNSSTGNSPFCVDHCKFGDSCGHLDRDTLGSMVGLKFFHNSFFFFLVTLKVV